MAELKHDNWRGNTGGQPWMQRTLVKVLGHIDQRWGYLFAATLVPFYLLFNPKGFAAQYHFLRQRIGCTPLKAFARVWVNAFRFGQIIIDRFAVFGGRKFRFEAENIEEWWRLEGEQEGFVQLSSHTGNFEIVGYQLRPEHKQVHALVFMGETQTVMQNRQRVFAEHNVLMVPVMPDMSHIFALNNALSDGHIVSVPGDRLFGSAKSASCLFFGQEAKFPIGGLSLSVSRGCPALAVFAMKENHDTYRIFISNLSKIVETQHPEALAKKSTHIQALAQAYAAELEKVVRRYPTQWFNYYEFWKQ